MVSNVGVRGLQVQNWDLFEPPCGPTFGFRVQHVELDRFVPHSKPNPSLLTRVVPRSGERCPREEFEDIGRAS